MSRLRPQAIELITVLQALLFVAIALNPSCAAQGYQSEDIRRLGFNEKGEGGECDESEPLCWNEWEHDKALAIEAAMYVAVDDNAHPALVRESLHTIAQHMQPLAGKLANLELAYDMDEVSGWPAMVDALPDGELGAARDDLISKVMPLLQARVGSTLTEMAVHSEPVYLALAEEAGDVGSSAMALGDGESPAASLLSDELDESGYTEEMRQAFDLIRESYGFELPGFGVGLGDLIVYLYKKTGVLKIDYQQRLAERFGSLDPISRTPVHNGISRSAMVDQVVRSHYLYVAKVGILSTLAQWAQPTAGTAVSLGYEGYSLFKAHAEMGFEIAQIYGLDATNEQELLTVTDMLVAVMLGGNSADYVVSNVAVPLIVNRASARWFGGAVTYSTISKGASAMLRRFTGPVMKRALSRGAQAVGMKVINDAARVGATSTAKIAGQKVPKWALIALIAGTSTISALMNVGETALFGTYVENKAKRWLAGLESEGLTFLSRHDARNCFFDGMSDLAHADGDLDEREQLFFQANLMRPYVEEVAGTDAVSRAYLADEAIQRYTAELRDARTTSASGNDYACLGEAFTRAGVNHRLNALAGFYGMANIDGYMHGDELRIYNAIEAQLANRQVASGGADDPTAGTTSARVVPEDLIEHMQRSARLFAGEHRTVEETRNLVRRVIEGIFGEVPDRFETHWPEMLRYMDIETDLCPTAPRFEQLSDEAGDNTVQDREWWTRRCNVRTIFDATMAVDDEAP